MKKIACGIILLLSMNASAQKVAYLFPGQGSDGRIFRQLYLPDGYDAVVISYPTPARGESMADFAMRLLPQIDTLQPFVLIGMSMGGMIVSELLDHISPEKAIIISSARKRSEMPFLYRSQRYFPLHKITPGAVMKRGALMLQPLVEPDRKTYKNTFKAMLKSKKPVYYKRTVNMIVNWMRDEVQPEIIHIHGTQDRTIPFKNVKPDYTVEEGSHMMTLTRGIYISELISQILDPDQNLN